MEDLTKLTTDELVNLVNQKIEEIIDLPIETKQKAILICRANDVLQEYAATRGKLEQFIANYDLFI